MLPNKTAREERVVLSQPRRKLNKSTKDFPHRTQIEEEEVRRERYLLPRPRKELHQNVRTLEQIDVQSSGGYKTPLGRNMSTSLARVANGTDSRKKLPGTRMAGCHFSSSSTSGNPALVRFRYSILPLRLNSPTYLIKKT